MADPPPNGVRRAAVEAALHDVYDPELDRPLTELRYVDRVDIEGPHVAVGLRLPTGLCAPAFAWMMASDVRDALLGLEGVTEATVRLRDHVHAEEITAGVNDGAAFGDVFDGSPREFAALRRKLDRKARLRRQHVVVDALLDAGVEPAAIVSLTHGDLAVGDDEAVFALDGTRVSVPAAPVEALLGKHAALGIPTGPDDPLFLTSDGEPIPDGEFEAVRRATRLASVNMAGQAHYCRGLLEERYGVEGAGTPSAGD